MKFPKGRPILENTRLEFINFDNVLSASKRERAHRISGYISIIYPDVQELIFLKEGEPFNAARISMRKREIVSISEVVEKAKNATSGILSEYATDEALLKMIIASITKKPIKTNIDLSRLQPRIFIDKLKNTKFDGFIWAVSGVEESFINFEQGEITGCYVAGSSKKIPEKEIIPFLMRPNLTISIFDRDEEIEADQATPAQVEMFCKIFTNLLKNYAHPLGKNLVLRTAVSARATAKKEFPFIENLTINSELNVKGKVIVEPMTFARGMARWFDIIYESVATFLGKESETIAKKSLNDYRFALKALKFFDYTKLKI